MINDTNVYTVRIIIYKIKIKTPLAVFLLSRFKLGSSLTLSLVILVILSLVLSLVIPLKEKLFHPNNDLLLIAHNIVILLENALIVVELNDLTLRRTTCFTRMHAPRQEVPKTAKPFFSGKKEIRFIT